MDGLIAYVLAKKYADKVGQEILAAGFKVQVETDRSILSKTGKEKILYLIPKESEDPKDGYDEYVYASNKWEWLGHTDIDLSGYQLLITEDNKLLSDLVYDEDQTNKFVTAEDIIAWNAKYDKPQSGIQKEDLDSSVQTSLGKADTALQSETYTGTITGITMNGVSKGTSGVVDLGTVITDDSGKENTSNKVTYWQSNPDDNHYPSEKLVKDSLPTCCIFKDTGIGDYACGLTWETFFTKLLDGQISKILILESGYLHELGLLEYKESEYASFSMIDGSTPYEGVISDMGDQMIIAK